MYAFHRSLHTTTFQFWATNLNDIFQKMKTKINTSMFICVSCIRTSVDTSLFQTIILYTCTG